MVLHDKNMHIGFQRLYETARNKYYFPKMYVMLRDYVNSCLTCQRIKHPHPGKPVPIINLPVSRPLSRFQVDFHGMYPPSWSYGHDKDSKCPPNRYVLTVIDCSSMWCELIPTPNCSAEVVCQALYDNVVTRIGVPI